MLAWDFFHLFWVDGLAGKCRVRAATASTTAVCECCRQMDFVLQGSHGTTPAKYLDLQQKGSVITGHFKGPNQSGGVEGTIQEQHLVVRTKTRNVLTFRGRVEGPRVQGVVQGNTFNGTFHDRGGTGSFQGLRSN